MRLRWDKMAKKRKKDKKKEEEEYEFTPPEFNEREFLEKELKETRAAIITVGIAVVFGVLAAVVTAMTPGLIAVAFVIGVAGMFLLKYVYGFLRIDISGFTKKNWAGTIVTYFFTFLAIWVLLINTPFADLADPSIDQVTIWVSVDTTLTGITYKQNSSTKVMEWLRVDNDAKPEAGLIHTTDNYTINITARIADTGGLASAEIAISSTSDYKLMAKGGTGKFEYRIDGGMLSGQSVLTFFLHAEDKNGNEQLFNPPSIAVSP